MKRKTIFENMLLDIATRLNISGHLTQEKKEEFEENLAIGLDKAIVFLKGLESSGIDEYDSIYSKFISFINVQNSESLDDLEDDIPVTPTKQYDIKQEYINQSKQIVTSSDPIVFTTSSLFSYNRNEIIDFAAEGGNLVWKGIERLWANWSVNSQETQDFWGFCRNYCDDKYYIQTNIEGGNPSEETAWRIYCYNYLKIVNETRFEVPELLKIANGIISTSLQFNYTAKYEQFLDVNDVLNEVKHADDALTRFLKVYQVLEQLAYRKEFIKLIKEHEDNHHPIVRSIQSVTDSFKKDEKVVFEQLFKEEFKELYNKIDEPDSRHKYTNVEPTCLNLASRNKIQNLYNIQANNSRPDMPYYNATQMAKIVYQIRCSIVHNKETELHFTYNNISDYKDIIDLINTLSTKLSEVIVSLISDGTNTPLTYRNKTLTLY